MRRHWLPGKNLVLGLFVVCSATVVIGILALFLEQKRAATRILEESFRASAVELGRNIALYVKVYNVHGIQRLVGGSFLARNADSLSILGDGDKPLLSYPDTDSAVPIPCLGKLTETDITFGEQKIGIIRYCIDIDKYTQLSIPYQLVAGLTLSTIAIALLFFFWLRRQTRSIDRFVSVIDSLDAEAPKTPEIPLVDRNDEVISSLYRKMSQLLARLESAAQEIQRREQEAVFVDLSRQVAHDIRSPLMALNVAIDDLGDSIAENKRVILRAVANRISRIASELMQKNKGIKGDNEPSEKTGAIQVASLCSALFNEKELQYSAREKVRFLFNPSFDQFSWFVMASEEPLRRTLSNLVDNAVQAIDAEGEIQVRLLSTEKSVLVRLDDTGKGIPKELVPQLIKKFATFGKNNGTGLGLYNADLTVRGWGGSLSLESTVGRGTTVSLTLQRVAPPPWFISEIAIDPGSELVILDDDQFVHEVWQKKATLTQSVVHHFSTPHSFVRWHNNQRKPIPKFTLLIDHYFVGASKSGLDLISEMNLVENTILVTNLYDDKQIRDRSLKLGIPVVPKPMLSEISIVVRDTGTTS